MGKKEYLVEITKKSRCWIEAYDEDEAESIAEGIGESENEEVDSVDILDVREIEDDDEILDEYLNDYDDEQE